MDTIEQMNTPFCGAVIEYISRGSDTTEELVTEGYDIMCVLSGSSSFVEAGVERRIYENEIHIFSRGVHSISNRVGSDGVFRDIVIHIDQDKLFGRVRHSSREQERFEEAILKGISSNISIDELADICCLSASTFKRRFRERYSSSPHKWFLSCRLEMAAMILKQTDVPTRYIASLCGFINVSHFIATFKRRFGTTPSHIARQV
ncbi:MAG: helix-turn-helix transcriptional regulator [Alistipes sp.]|nr:helix-turn-helix transcriptional regulator [Alistipes sp.]MBO7263926.1 helix-turn-helix transcriptional regulator [Alistipes sp.]